MHVTTMNNMLARVGRIKCKARPRRSGLCSERAYQTLQSMLLAAFLLYHDEVRLPMKPANR